MPFSVLWWALRDLNSRHPPCKGGALPTELNALNILLSFRASKGGFIGLAKLSLDLQLS